MTAVLLALAGLAAAGTLMFLAPSRRAGSLLFEFAALVGLLASVRGWLSGETLSLRWPWALPFASFALTIDPLSSFFLVLLFLLSAVVVIFGYGYTQHQEQNQKRGMWAFLTGLVVAMALVLLSANAVLFLFGWELMSLFAFFLVRSTGTDEAQKASWTFLVASHVSGAALVGFFLAAGRNASSLDFSQLALHGVPEGARSVVFLLALIGFGLKAGLVPFHFWLPKAHPAAPSHVSALLSGLMIKLGFYGFLRTLPWLGSPALWWAWVLLALGGFSGFFAVLQVHAQADWKRALAYSSVENMGLATLGLGLSLWATTVGRPEIAATALAAMLLHLFSHALAKGSFFMIAGCIDHATGTRNPDLLGGLGRQSKTLTIAAMLAVAAMSGLPPTLAFFSEFLLLYTGVQAVMSGATLVGTWVVGLVSLIAGIAVFGFAKLYAATFLGEPRSEASDHPRKLAPTLEMPPLVLASLAVVSGLASPWLMRGVIPVAQVATSFSAEAISVSLWRVLLILLLTAGSGLLVGTVATGALYLALRRRAVVRRTWDCGYLAPTPRMQYTASGSSQILLRFFRPLAPAAQPRIETVLFPAPRTVGLNYCDPLLHALQAFGQKAQNLLPQVPLGKPGKVSLYVLFVALTLVALLLAEVLLW